MWRDNVCKNQKQRELLTEILQVWAQLKLPEWDKYDWACYSTLSNDQLQEALNSLKLETTMTENIDRY
jgi:hypothetical protein